jgi:hypothetical protein
MLTQLSESISSFNRQSRKTVNQVLSESIVEKAEIGSLVSKIGSFSSAADYIPSLVNSLSTIQKEPIIDLFRDMDLRIKSTYDISRTLSILRSSMSSIFSGEIEKLEKDISYLESYINNWVFLSGEEDLYDHIFVENFDNDLNSHIYADTISKIPDRNGVPFSASESSFVDSFSGTLKYSKNYEQILTSITIEDIENIIYHKNFSEEYISSDTGIRKVLNASSSHIWNLTVKSPVVIKENIFDKDIFSSFKTENEIDSSAQIGVEIVFKSPKQISRIRITPNTSDNMDLLQVIVQSMNNSAANVAGSTSSNKYKILPNSIRIKNSLDVELPGYDFVKSVILIFGQKNYTRTKITPLQSEVNTKLVNQISAAIRLSRKQHHDKLQDTVIKYFIKDFAFDYINRNKKLYYYDYTDYYPTDYEKINVGVIEKLKEKNFFSDIDDLNQFKNTSLLSNIVFSIISYSVGSKLRSIVSKTYIESNLKESTKNVWNYASGGIIPLFDSNKSENNGHFSEDSIDYVNSITSSQFFDNVEDPGMYEYIFSIKNISFFSKISAQITMLPIPLNRSVFVSRKIPIDGLPMRVKMNSEYFQELNYLENDPALDKTGAEFSVSIKDNPIFEEDWMPIIPYKDSLIRGELLYANIQGEANLRFLPSEESLKVFENSTQRDFGSYEVNGKILKIFKFNKNNRYYVSYIPLNIDSAKEASLFSRSMANPVLINASFDGVNGERFEKTNSDNSVRITYAPYISQEKLVNSVYSIINGTITANKSSFGNFDYSSYCPVKILFENGSTAINLTNYVLSSSQVPSFYKSDSVLFIHSGQTILFNKFINTPFRVIYQHIPNVFRYRIILRSLDNTSENYSVDRILFKFSLEKDSTINNNFIKYDNKYKKKFI